VLCGSLSPTSGEKGPTNFVGSSGFPGLYCGVAGDGSRACGRYMILHPQTVGTRVPDPRGRFPPSLASKPWSGKRPVETASTETRLTRISRGRERSQLYRTGISAPPHISPMPRPRWLRLAATSREAAQAVSSPLRDIPLFQNNRNEIPSRLSKQASQRGNGCYLEPGPRETETVTPII